MIQYVTSITKIGICIKMSVRNKKYARIADMLKSTLQPGLF